MFVIGNEDKEMWRDFLSKNRNVNLVFVRYWFMIKSYQSICLISSNFALLIKSSIL